MGDGGWGRIGIAWRMHWALGVRDWGRAGLWFWVLGSGLGLGFDFNFELVR
jgi:hypothetical protein